MRFNLIVETSCSFLTESVRISKTRFLSRGKLYATCRITVSEDCAIFNGHFW